MESVNILYRIRLSEQVTEEFDYNLDAETFEIVSTPKSDILPDWTELGNRQCPNCPLTPDKHPHCPMAVQLHHMIDRFHNTKSIDKVFVEVITEHRTISKNTDLQSAISSMLGLLFPISGCPKTEGMKPLARFHAPMAAEEETVFNVAGMYLLAQYFVNLKNKAGVFSFDGLIKIYEDLHIVNKSVASRLQNATRSDSVKNAITLLDMYSSLMPMLLQDQLVEIRNFFNAYLPNDEIIKPKSNYLEQAKLFKIIPTPEEEEVDIETKALAVLWAEEEKKILPELEGMAGWMQQSVLKEHKARFKPDMNRLKRIKDLLAASAKRKSPESSQSGKQEPKKPAYSEFVMNLSLEPIDEPKTESGAEPPKK
jgi:hypothetical protein